MLTAVVRAHRDRHWYRAGDSHHFPDRDACDVPGCGSGERVTLANLYRAGLLDRRAHRGEVGDADAAYEYAGSERLRAALGLPPLSRLRPP